MSKTLTHLLYGQSYFLSFIKVITSNFLARSSVVVPYSAPLSLPRTTTHRFGLQDGTSSFMKDHPQDLRSVKLTRTGEEEGLRFEDPIGGQA